MAKINATNIGVYVDSTLVGASTSGEISFSANMIETTSKDSGGDAEFIAGLRSCTISLEALYTDDDSDYNQYDIFTLLKNGTSSTIKFGTNTTGKKRFSISALVSSLSVNAPMEDAATFSAEFQGSGTPTLETIA